MATCFIPSSRALGKRSSSRVAPSRIVATPESLAVHPSQGALITFRLLDDQGEPLADRIVQFAIVDDPTTAVDEARGSTLSFDRGVTDSSGAATLQVIAGPEP